MSVKDSLTGVFNRRFMNLFLTKKIDKAKNLGDQFSIVMCDIDHFEKCHFPKCSYLSHRFNAMLLWRYRNEKRVFYDSFIDINNLVFV